MESYTDAAKKSVCYRKKKKKYKKWISFETASGPNRSKEKGKGEVVKC